MKKRLVGGDFLLDVSTIEFEETSTLTNITDTDVISQLTNLKKFISNPSMIKPIWVKLHDGDGKLVVTRGSLCVIDTDEFELDVILNGYTLRIHVKFTQVLNENDDPIDDWYIATNDAKYLFTTNNFATFKVANVKNIDGVILSQLKCGDVIIKDDASGEHAYIVTFKSETGICLTYVDAGIVETQSYDLVGDNWVYNSEDLSHLPINGKLDGDIDIDGDVSGKTFIQTQPNWELDLSESIIITGASEVKNAFCKLIQYGNVLYLILSIRFTRESATPTNITFEDILVDIPESIGSKIYDKNGDLVSEVPTTANMQILLMKAQIYDQGKNIGILHYAQNKITIQLSTFNTTVSAVGGYNVDGRTFIVL